MQPESKTLPFIPTHSIKDFFEQISKPFNIIPFDMSEVNYQSGNISLYEMVVICLLCKNCNPTSILEFGTFNGRTTTNIAVNTKEYAKIITVDLPVELKDKTRFPLEGINKTDENDELGYVGKTGKLYEKYPLIRKKINQFWMDSADFPINQYLRHFDFIFVDASHTYENTLNDSHNAFKCIKNKGFILWHDYHGWPGVTKALNEIYAESIDAWNFTHIEGTSMVLYYANSY
jgi:predicted O-methyltransferase YrrM